MTRPGYAGAPASESCGPLPSKCSSRCCLQRGIAGGTTIDEQNISGSARVVNGDVHYHGSYGSTGDYTKTQWYSTLCFKRIHSNIQERASIKAQSTSSSSYSPGQWLLKSNAFRDWKSLNSPRRNLWYHGMGGVGKTVLSSIIVSHLLQLKEEAERESPPSSLGVVYLYLQVDNEPYSIKELLGSSINQITESPSYVPDRVDQDWQTFKAGRLPPKLKNLARLFRILVAEGNRPVFVVLDGLDEYPPEKRAELLSGLGSESPNLRLLVVSRNFDSSDVISKEFNVENLQPEMRDVEHFIDHTFNDPTLWANVFRHNPSLRSFAKEVIKNHSCGRFSLTQRFVRKLLGAYDVTDFCTIINNISNHLDEHQRFFLNRAGRYPFARDVLFFVAFCCRPLTIKELQYGVLEPGVTVEVDDMLKGCNDLLVVINGKVDMQPMVKDSLRRIADTDPGLTLSQKDFHLAIARKCISSIKSRILYDSDSQPLHTNNESDLFHYATTYLWHHLRKMKHKSEGFEIATDLSEILIDPKKRNLLVYMLSGRNETHDSEGQCTQTIRAPASATTHTPPNGETTAIHVAATLGWASIMTTILPRLLGSVDINALDEAGRSAFQLAAHGEHWGIVRELLVNGALVDLQTYDNHTELLRIAQHGLKDIAELIILTNLRCFPDFPIDTAELSVASDLTAAAVSAGRSLPTKLRAEIVDHTSHYLQSDTMRRPYSHFRETSIASDSSLLQHILLLRAVMTGQSDTVKHQLDNCGISHQNQSFFVETALFLAVEFNHVAIVDLLLKHGADSSCTGPDGCLPLQRARFRGNEEIVDMLLRWPTSRCKVNIKEKLTLQIRHSITISRPETPCILVHSPSAESETSEATTLEYVYDSSLFQFPEKDMIPKQLQALEDSALFKDTLAPENEWRPSRCDQRNSSDHPKHETLLPIQMRGRSRSRSRGAAMKRLEKWCTKGSETSRTREVRMQFLELTRTVENMIRGSDSPERGIHAALVSSVNTAIGPNTIVETGDRDR